MIDTESDLNTQDTARRVAKMYLMEVFAGRYVPQPPVTESPDVRRLNELMIVGPVTVRSACSHHLCPSIGRVWVGVMPDENSALIANCTGPSSATRATATSPCSTTPRSPNAGLRAGEWAA